MWNELVWAVPFISLLMLIALLPLLAARWWARHYALVAVGLGAVVFLRYLCITGGTELLLRTGLEYAGFIALIGSLYIVSGGIHIDVKGESTPGVNCLFLLIGALAANVVGTTGAAALLIRPWLRMNRYRITAYHIVFFIFIVCNIGGALTPVGDPPLFLGYLKGVPFFWVGRAVWPVWALTVTYLLIVFYWLDRRNFMRAPRSVRQKETGSERWEIGGWKINLPLLAVILTAVFIQRPPLAREFVMLLCAVASYWLTPKSVHQKNDFSLAPIREVAVLFLGIFATMIPALQWLEHHAQTLGLQSAGQFYWACGILSGVLDNAPTYLNFLSAALGLFATSTASLAVQHPLHLKSISVAAVFFGAMTYIGNGPNFLVKSIAEQSKIRTPHFFDYILRYSAPILLPMLTAVWWVFFR